MHELNRIYGDIYEVVSRYVTLNEHGDKYRGKCPWCREETLLVNPKAGVFYCETCGNGGNAPKFLSLIEGISYTEASKRLGIPIERTNTEELIKTLRKVADRLEKLHEEGKA